GGGNSYGGFLYTTLNSTATINASTITNCMGAYGGAIDSRGTFTMTGCTVSGNTSFNFGGGAFTTWTPTGPTTLINSTFTGNQASSAGNGYGGAICAGSSNVAAGTFTITNCTISGNTSKGG